MDMGLGAALSRAMVFVQSTTQFASLVVALARSCTHSKPSLSRVPRTHGLECQEHMVSSAKNTWSRVLHLRWCGKYMCCRRGVARYAPTVMR
jgi:hypothetical protein